MPNYITTEAELTSVANAIRTKGQTQGQLEYPAGFITAIQNIPGGVAPTPQELTFTGVCTNLFYGGTFDWLLSKYGSQMTFTNINALNDMFYGVKLSELSIPAINCQTSSYYSLNGCFDSSNLKVLPAILNAVPNNVASLCARMKYLRNIPEDYFDTWNFSMYTGSFNLAQVFSSCISLRNVPEGYFDKLDEITPYSSTSSSYFGLYYLCTSNYALDELTNVTFNSAWKGTTNYLENTIIDCYRLKDFIFKINQDGTPRTGLFKGQTFDFSTYTGWAKSDNPIINYNSGITRDKKVTDAASYAALKNDPDWYTLDVNYSRYNHDSAVRTINTLPDCHATGTNTIKFKGQAGALTDGGAINTLTNEEIAVAAAKGWTVTFE